MPFYIQSEECYIKVLTLDRMPASGSPLNQIVKRVLYHGYLNFNKQQHVIQ